MIILDVSQGNIEIKESGDYEIIGQTDKYNIYINCKANITLKNVDIDVTKKSTAAMILDELSDITLTFIDINNLKSADNYAGIQIEGKSSILIQGDENSTLNIYSGTSGSGIGGGYGKDLEGTVTIQNGNINIVSTREGAGIGGGNGTNGGGNLSGKLVIEDGNINIKPGDYGGAGIGGGCSANLSGSVIINGGIINCKGGEYAIGAGIGGGYDGNLSGDVIINGGDTQAIGGEGASGIGSGVKINRGGNLSGTVTINGGTVNAQGGLYIDNYGGAGIGSGYGGDLSGNLVLNGGEITAKGAGNANDIGSGSGGDITGDVSIKVYNIEVNPNYLSLKIGESSQITATVTINPTINANIENYKKVQYTSQNEAIAIVDENGVVTGFGDGETEIIATSLFDKTKSAICNVNINGKNINLGDIDLLIKVEKDEINPDDLDRIVCYGNNPIIKQLYIDSNMKNMDIKVDIEECLEVVNATVKYNYVNVYLYIKYSIVLYTTKDCVTDLKIYALEDTFISSNLSFCLNIDEEFNISDYKIIINPIYTLDEKYSEKYYVFKIRGNIELQND